MAEEERTNSDSAPSESTADDATEEGQPAGADEPDDGQGNAELDSFPVVGIGASAGGLEALKQFFSHMPPKSGMAFVVVTHQHPGHTSLMPELLSRQTSMPVRVATSGTRVEPDCVYVSPPGASLAMLEQTLHEMEPEQAALRLPIDYFFRSLAQDQRERAIGIILSGTGTDGTVGLKEIKGASGMVMVQDEQTAQYAGMPHSAIATQLVDYVLPVDEMPRQLLAYAGGPYLSAPSRAREEEPPEAIQQVLVLLRNHTGHDFSNYKRSTITRRIERRMNVHQIESARSYTRFLQTHPSELDVLFKELLIGVTSFFRDPSAFEALGQALPELLEPMPAGHVVRVWVVGCSSGEEAYSLAILLREVMDRLGQRWSVQIFATDLDGGAIDVARTGVYLDGIAVDVSPARLERFFLRADGGYRVRQEIREMLVFAPQNLISDPPFTKLDLLSCRNLLIYLDGTVQKRLLPVFHYALRPGGLLFLGSSESVGSFGHMFETIDKRSKVFRRREVPAGTYQAEFPATLILAQFSGSGPHASERGAKADTLRLAEKLMLRKLVPPSALVRERGDVVHIHGRTGQYLEPAPGPQTQVNIFNMAREGLQIHLAAAIRQAANRVGEAVVRRGVRVRANGGHTLVDLRVEQLTQPEPFQGLFLVSFERPPLADPETSRDAGERGEPTGREAELERELRHTRESHQGTIEELETTNEELKSTNEELQSTNEELQSANEELETSKEEMQSLNEELQTVNAELQGKVEELSRANDDMKNLLNGTEIATVFLDNQLKIKRFTEQAKQVIRLIPSDVDRPIGDLVTRFHYDQLEADAREVLRTLAFKEIEVRGERGWYLLRILPYRTTENLIEGLVITFVDVTKLKGLEERVQHALRGSATSVCGQGCELRYTWVCSSGLLGLPPEAVVGKTDADLFPEAEAAALDQIKRRVLETGEPAREELELSVAGEPRMAGVFVTAVCDAERITGVACVYTDITGPGGEA